MKTQAEVMTGVQGKIQKMITQVEVRKEILEIPIRKVEIPQKILQIKNRIVMDIEKINIEDLVK